MMTTQASAKIRTTTDAASIGELVRTATTGDTPGSVRNQAFGQIVARFQDMAYGMAFTLLGDAAQAEDAAQEAFLAAWRQLENLREPDAFPGWFQCIVRTQCHRMTRGKRLPVAPLHLVGDAPASRQTDPVVQATQAERQAQVQTALAALPDHERTATVLYYLGDEDQGRIADFLGVPVTTIKKRIFSARKRLRERMTPYMEPQEIIQEATDTRRPSRDTQFSRRVLLWAAVEEGDATQVSQLLAEDPTLTRTSHANGETPLHLAAHCGYGKVVEALIQAGADVNARQQDGQTPLHTLTEGAADVDIAAMLLGAGAQLTLLDDAQRTPLAMAIQCATPPAEDDADHFAFAEFLLSRGAELDIFAAVALDRAEEIPKILERYPTALAQPDSTGDLPIHVAARAGFRRSLAALLHAGADPNVRNRQGQTALQIAAQPGRLKKLPTQEPVVRLLREKGAEVDVLAAALLGDAEHLATFLTASPEVIGTRDAAGATPLLLAAWQGHCRAVALLLERGADVHARDTAGRSAISVRWHASDVDAETVEQLIAAGVTWELSPALALHRADDVEALLLADPTRATTEQVAWAIENGIAPPLIERLIAYGPKLSPHEAAALGMTELLARFLTADPEMPRRRDADRMTPLHRGTQKGQQATVAFLLQRGARLDAMNNDGSTPLHLAVSGRHSSVVQHLLEAGAAVDQRNHRGETALFAACANGDVATTMLLLGAGANANRLSNSKTTPLHLAVQTGDITLVEQLLERGAQREARNYYGATPLHIAVREGHTALVQHLLAAGADKLARDQWHRTPLHTATWFDRAEVVEILLEAGVSTNELSYGFSTPLHTAAERGSTAVAERLIAHGAEVNARSDFGRTPLHDAVHGNRPEMVALLLRHGADPTSPNNRQMTPLHWAAAAGKSDIVRLLVEAGADTTIRSYKDETPADLALRYHHAEIATVLGALPATA